MQTEIYRQKVNDLNARAKRAGAKGRLNANDLYAVLEYCGNHCQMEGCTNTDVTFDHVEPLEHGGLNARSNLGLLCESHNKGKSDNIVPDYREGRICPDDYVATKQGETYKKHDWDEIEADYIYGTLSMRELAKKHSVSERQLFGVAVDNEWVIKRQKNSSKIAAEIRKEIEAKNIEDGFSAYKGLYLTMRRGFDDYMADPSPEKLRALNDTFEKGLAMEGHETQRKSLVLKDWRDAAAKNGEHADDIQQFATHAADDYYERDSGGDRESSAGWTD